MTRSRLTGTYRIGVEFPPDLLRAVGYTGSARWVGLWYIATNTTYADGRLSASGWFWPYQRFLDLPIVDATCRALKAHLGYDEEPPADGLLFDTREQAVFLAPLALVRQQLLVQWPWQGPQRPVTLTPEQWEQLVAEVTAQVRLSQEERTAREAERRAAEQRFYRWCDQLRLGRV